MTESLAESVLCSVTSPGNAFRLRDWYRNSGGDAAGLAAVRVLGPDMLAPFVLHGYPLNDADAEVVLSAVRAYPAPEPVDTEAPLVWHYRDWALARLLAGLGATDGPIGAAGAGPPDTRHLTQQPWVRQARFLARLSAVALPCLHSPLREEVTRTPADLERGLVRSMLRRDHLTAARLARWLALTGRDSPGLSLDSALTHLEFLAAASPRALLEIAIARKLPAGT